MGVNLTERTLGKLICCDAKKIVVTAGKNMVQGRSKRAVYFITL